jgi:predicted AAA+ superfamily ATPase
LNGLKAMGIIFFTHPFSKNIIKRIIKNPKLYFYDTGLVAYLLGFTDTKSLLNSSFAGHIFECYVISNIYKGFINAGQNPSLFYIKEQRLVEADKQKEIDLILEGEGGKVYPIEIKMRVLANIHDFDNVSLLNKEKNEIASMTVVCCATSVTTLGKDKLVLPVTCL